MKHLSLKIYKNDFVNTFEGDKSGRPGTRETPGVLYSLARPTPVSQPKLLAWSHGLAAELGIMSPDEKDLQILGGNLVTDSMNPYAACYAGHQFGNWAGQLGDGRAITVGEWEASSGHTYELQLKGAGPTPYSRRADGRAVLRSSLREYLMSEAMHYLGVPTTRALSLVSTGDQVLRDMFYDGHPEYETGAIVLRVAPSFLRFGSFEMLAARQEKENLSKLTYWVIDRFYPHIQGKDKILLWLREVMERTARLMVEWLRVGFVHGVMNTDNMSILGFTIDYGPYSFVDAYDPDFTPNTTDLPGKRYAFGQQSAVAFWNIECLASAIAPLFKDTDPIAAILDDYENTFLIRYYHMMSGKLGLDEVKEGDATLFEQFQLTLSLVQPDMTIFFQLLIYLPLNLKSGKEIIDYFKASYYQDLNNLQQESIINLIHLYIKRISRNTISREEAKRKMQQNNPRFILRNYMLHQAIEELEKGDDQLFLKLQEAMKEPYSNKWDEFFKIRPSWAAQKAGCSMLSCSS